MTTVIRYGAAAGGAVLLTLLVTWPLARCLSSCLGPPPDTLVSTYFLAWVARALTTPGIALLDAPMFAPYPNTLALGEYLPAYAPIAIPVIALTGNPVVAHNVVLLVLYASAALGVYALAPAPSRRGRAGGPRGGELRVLGAPARPVLQPPDDVGRLGTLALPGSRALRRAALPRARDPASPAGARPRPVEHEHVRVHGRDGSRLARRGGDPGPCRHPPCRPARRRGGAGRRHPVGLRGALPASRTGVAARAHLGGRRERRDDARPRDAAPPRIAPSLGHVGSARGRWSGRGRSPRSRLVRAGGARPRGPLVGTTGGRRGLSCPTWSSGAWPSCSAFGPTLRTGWGSVPLPYRVLYAFVPGFDAIRTPARFLLYVDLALALLAGAGAARLLRRIALRWRTVGLLALLGLVLLEAVLIPFPGGVPRLDPAALPEAYRWLRAAPPGTVALGVPMGDWVQRRRVGVAPPPHHQRLVELRAAAVSRPGGCNGGIPRRADAGPDPGRGCGRRHPRRPDLAHALPCRPAGRARGRPPAGARLPDARRVPGERARATRARDPDGGIADRRRSSVRRAPERGTGLDAALPGSTSHPRIRRKRRRLHSERDVAAPRPRARCRATWSASSRERRKRSPERSRAEAGASGSPCGPARPRPSARTPTADGLFPTAGAEIAGATQYDGAMPGRPSSRSTHILLIGLLFVLSPLHLLGLLSHASTHILGDVMDTAQYLQNEWWTAHALLDLRTNPFRNDHMFHPFGFHMIQHNYNFLDGLLYTFARPVVPLLIFHNALTWLSVFLNSLAAYCLILSVTGMAGLAFVGAVAFAHSPVLTSYHGAQALLEPYMLVFFVLASLALFTRPSYPRAIGAGILLGLSVYTYPYYFVAGLVWLGVILGYRVFPWTIRDAEDARASQTVPVGDSRSVAALCPGGDMGADPSGRMAVLGGPRTARDLSTGSAGGRACAGRLRGGLPVPSRSPAGDAATSMAAPFEARPGRGPIPRGSSAGHRRRGRSPVHARVCDRGHRPLGPRKPLRGLSPVQRRPGRLLCALSSLALGGLWTHRRGLDHEPSAGGHSGLSGVVVARPGGRGFRSVPPKAGDASVDHGLDGLPVPVPRPVLEDPRQRVRLVRPAGVRRPSSALAGQHEDPVTIRRASGAPHHRDRLSGAEELLSRTVDAAGRPSCPWARS